jgi:hypothetical protein
MYEGGLVFAALTELVKRTCYLLRIWFVIHVLFPNHQTVISGIIVKAYFIHECDFWDNRQSIHEWPNDPQIRS